MKSFLPAAIFITLFTLNYVETTAQITTTVILEYTKDEVLKDSFYFHIMKPLQAENFGEPITYKDKLISYSEKNGVCRIVSQFEAKDTTLAYLAELFGHELMIIPGDTINLKALQKKSRSIQPTEFPSRNPGRYQLVYSGTNKFNYEFSDSLALVAGDPRFDFIHFKKTDHLNLFLDKVKNYYNLRVSFLQDYSKRHNLPKTFIGLMRSELKSAYIKNLCAPLESGLSTIEKYPSTFVQLLDSCSINNEYLYYHTSLYADYTLSVINYQTLKNTVASLKKNMYFISYKFIKENSSDALRDHVLTNYLTGNAYFQPEPFDSLYADYLLTCTNEDYKHQLGDLVKQNHVKLNKLKSLTIINALAADVMDNTGKVFALNKMLDNNKPTIIDCWATWCVPCMKELPLEKNFQQEYGNKVNFISLSFDRNQKDWEKGPRQLLSNLNYFLVNAFKSDFASYFKMNSIPRYIVIDKGGNLLAGDAVRPSMKKEFRQMIEQLTKNQVN